MLFVALTLVACHRGPNQKELTALEETKQAALASQEKASNCQTEKASLENQVAQQKQKLDQMKQEKQLVSQRLEEFGK